MRMNEDEDQQEAKVMKEVADVNKHEQHSKKTKKGLGWWRRQSGATRSFI